MARRRTDPPEPLDRGELRAALLDLLRLAALWESGALARGRAETRAADERLLRDVVRASQEHQSGEKSVPVARVGKHLVRRVDLQLARVHERVAGVLRELDGPIDAEVLDPRRAAFASGGLKGVTRETLARPPKSSLSAPPTGQTLQVPSGQAWKVYYYAGSQRIAVRVLTSSSDTLYYLHADHLGSTSLTTDSNGNRIGELKYYPFGQTRSTWGSTPTDRRFTGQQEESALGSLYEFNARYYSPSLGRFLSADTIVPQAGNPQAWNRYAYVVNSPLKYTDPSGHCFIILCIVAIGAAVVSVAAATEAIAYTAEVVQTGSGWDATEYWNRVNHPRPETLGTAAVVVATTLAEPLDYLATGIQCLTSGCSVADVALTVVPGGLGAIRKSLGQAVDAAQALENAGDAAHGAGRPDLFRGGDTNNPNFILHTPDKPGPKGVIDIQPDADGYVGPGSGGLSTLSEPKPSWHYPWKYPSTAPEPQGIRIFQDDPADPRHWLWEPSWRMPLSEFKQRLKDTRGFWEPQ